MVVRQGDILRLNLNPIKGHEQAGYRPVLVVNNTIFSQASRMILVCPITNTDRHNPLHIRLTGLQTTGVVMCDQIRAIDLGARDFSKVETVGETILWEVCDVIHGAVEVEVEE